MKQIKLSFLAYYYLLKSLLFKLLLLNPKAKQTIAKRCSEDIIFWLEFFVKLPQNQTGIARKASERGKAPLCGKGDHPPETNTTSIESVRKATEGGVSGQEDHPPKNNSPVPIRQEENFFNKQENPGIAGKASERGNAPLSDSLGSSPFLKGLGKESLPQRIQQLKNSFKPRTSYNTYYWLKYKKDYILELKERIENNKPLLVAKSANMDETTCTALVLLWFWLHKENANFYTLGQTVKHLYYTKDSHSIFNLYKYVLNNLPYSLYKTDQPPPKTNKQNKLPYKLTVNRKKKFFVKLTNLNNGNIIYGFSGSKRNYFPQHKEIKAVWLNNFAFHKKQQEHYSALQNISNCLIITSIPNGNGNLFYELSISKRIERYKLHWVLNPHYDEKWYSNVIASTELNNVHQFLDIGYEYKIKRRRLIKTSTPLKKAAKKVAVVQATTRTKSSTFCKTFTSTRNTPRKIYHRNSFAYTPDNYETVKKSLANTALRAINIPSTSDENISAVIRWQKMNKLIRQNNKAQISSIQTALKVLFHHQPELTNVLLQQPQMPIVNNGIKNQYTEEELKKLFPGIENENEKKNPPPQSEEEIIKHINKIAVRKYNPMGIARKASERGDAPLSDSFGQAFFSKGGKKDSEATERSGAPLEENLGSKPFLKGLGNNSEATEKSKAPLDKNPGIGDKDTERGNDSLKRHCEEQSDAAILHTPDIDNDHKTGNRGIEKGDTPFSDSLPRVGGGFKKSLSPETSNNKIKDFFEKYKQKRTYKVRTTRFNITIKPPKHKQNNKGIGAESTERGESPLCGKWHLPPEEPP